MHWRVLLRAGCCGERGGEGCWAAGEWLKIGGDWCLLDGGSVRTKEDSPPAAYIVVFIMWNK